jgi:mannose-P-dolichol utilization defect protein 1
MVALIDIPLVLPLAKWIWGGAVTEEVSPEICVEQIPFISSGCFTPLLTKALGVVVILGSCLNKIPIMLNMMKTQSAAGISRNSLYGEALVYGSCALYGFLSGHPFTAYGENVSLPMQNTVLILMSWQFSAGVISSQEKGTAIVGFATYVFAILNFLPESQRYLLMSSLWPVMLYARGSQVLETFQVKHTGNLSIATTTLSLVGALIRVVTTLKETGDMVVISGYLLSMSLSFAMFVQYWIYLEKTLEIVKKAKGTKEKKTN